MRGETLTQLVRAREPTASADAHAHDVLGRLGQLEVGKRRGDAVDLALGHPQVLANHLERCALEPAEGILHLVQRGQQIRPPARIRTDAIGQVDVSVHGPRLCPITARAASLCERPSASPTREVKNPLPSGGGCIPRRYCHCCQPRAQRLRLGRRRLDHPNGNGRAGEHADTACPSRQRGVVLLRLGAARRTAGPPGAVYDGYRPDRPAAPRRARAGACRHLPRLLRPDQQRGAVDAAAPRHRQRRFRIPRLRAPSGLGSLSGSQCPPGGGDRARGPQSAGFSDSGLSPVPAARPAARRAFQTHPCCTSLTFRSRTRQSCG